MKTQTIQGLIREQCANHENNFNKNVNFCLTEECPDNKCIYFYDDKDNYYIIRCKYFEECVLPLNKELEIKYWEAIKGNLSEKELTELHNKISKNAKSSLICKCGKEFKAKSNRQKVCQDCQKKNRKQYQQKIMKERRNKNNNKKIEVSI
jgi:hypothetical protein